MPPLAKQRAQGPVAPARGWTLRTGAKDSQAFCAQTVRDLCLMSLLGGTSSSYNFVIAPRLNYLNNQDVRPCYGNAGLGWVRVGAVAVEWPQSQLRGCGCDCQSGSWMVAQGSFLSTTIPLDSSFQCLNAHIYLTGLQYTKYSLRQTILRVFGPCQSTLGS